MIDLRTLIFMLTGLIGGIVANLPLWAWMQGDTDTWMRRFPLSWIGVGLSTMSGFFHEIGHTVTFWYYGYVAVPMFDFIWGGGEAMSVTGQLKILLLVLYAGIGYCIFMLKGERLMQGALAALLLFNLATAFTDYHEVMISFMGPGAQALFGGFMLYRAWMDLAPRGDTERWLNAMIGFGMTGQVWLEGWNLLHNPEYREMYDHQKGGEGLGDFSKIADILNVPFARPVEAWLWLDAVCVIMPFLIYLFRRKGFAPIAN